MGADRQEFQIYSPRERTIWLKRFIVETWIKYERGEGFYHSQAANTASMSGTSENKVQYCIASMESSPASTSSAGQIHPGTRESRKIFLEAKKKSGLLKQAMMLSMLSADQHHWHH